VNWDWNSSVETLKAAIRDVPDFPKPGIIFKDITPVLAEPRLYRRLGDLMTALCGHMTVDKVVAIESRGFILGSLLADRLGAGFVPVRKRGKLPARTLRAEYALEYGTDTLEIHADALAAGENVLIVDDVIATGGTAAATGELVAQLGARIGAYVFMVELGFLEGRAKLGAADVLSLIRY
jgi:adenine phosphoribosyltransferase